jgi:N-terminal domain of NWD NACHT-NTPase
LQLFLNAPEQKASRLAGLEEITGIIRDCSILENLYQRHYETDDGQQLQEVATTSNNAFRNSMMALYTSVLKFQVTIITYHSGKKLQRLVDDVAKWTDWDGLTDEIRAAYKGLDSIAKRWITFGEQTDRELLKRSLEQRFQHLVANQNKLLDIQRNRDRSRHLKWLQSVGENVSASEFQNNLSGHRGKLETGEWLLADPKFMKWEKEPNQFLWLYGKGKPATLL